MLGNQSKTTANIMIDLDSVLDTRLPVLYAIHKPTAIAVMKDDRYRKRIKDSFGDIPYTVFEAYYRLRNKNILKLATATPMIELLKEYCNAAHNTMITEDGGDIPTLYVNSYPYELNDEERGNILKLFHHATSTAINIELVHLSIPEVTPRFISTTMSTYIRYDMLRWLEYHNSTGELSKYPLLDCSCIAPLIDNSNKPTQDLTQEDFDNTRATLGPLTSLVLLQSRVFSVV